MELPIVKISLSPSISYVNITENLLATDVIYEKEAYLFVRPIKSPSEIKSFKRRMERISFDLCNQSICNIIKPCFWVDEPFGLLLEACTAISPETEYVDAMKMTKMLKSCVLAICDLHDYAIVHLGISASSVRRCVRDNHVKLLVDFFEMQDAPIRAERWEDENESYIISSQEKRHKDVISLSQIGEYWNSFCHDEELGSLLKEMAKGCEAITILRKLWSIHKKLESSLLKQAIEAPKASVDMLPFDLDTSDGSIRASAKISWGKYVWDHRKPLRYSVPAERVFLCSQNWLTFGQGAGLSSVVLIFYISPGKFAIDVQDFGWMIRRPGPLKSIFAQIQKADINAKLWTWKTKDAQKPDTIFLDSDVAFALIDKLKKEGELEFGLDGRLTTIFAICNQVMREFPPCPLDLADITTEFPMNEDKLDFDLLHEISENNPPTTEA